MPRLRCAGLLLLLLTPPMQAQVEPTRASVDSFIRAQLASRIGTEIGSASLAVVSGDQVVYLESLGLSQPARKSQASPTETIYQVGSNSKLFVATAALQLVEQGKLDLNTDINQYLKDLQVDGRGGPVTMAQLLTHTSGIDDRKLGRTQSLSDGPLMMLGQFFNRFPPRRVIPGGTELNYSGNAMALAAHVVEQISGESFDRYAARHIFIPLDMRHATFQQPLADSSRARRASMPNLPPLIAYPAGGLAMTAADMSRFMLAMLNGGAAEGTAILRPETIRLMQSHHFPADSTVPGIAYGFFEARLNGHRAILHTGDYQHQSVLCLFPDAKLGFFLVVNPIEELRKPLVSAFTSAFAQRFLPSGLVSSIAERTITPEMARRFEGYYRDDAIPHSTIERFFVGLLFGEGDATVFYSSADSSLLFQPPEAEPVRLSWSGGNRFHTTDKKLGAEIVFQMEDNRVTGFFAGVGPLGAYTFRRIPWLLSQRNQFGYLFVGLVLWASWLLIMTVRLIRARRRHVSMAPEEVLPLTALSVCSALAVGGFLLFSILGFRIPSVAMMTGIPAAFYALPLCFSGACLAALLLPWTLVRVWRGRLFGATLRMSYSIVALAAIGLVPFCWYWRLLALQL